MPETQIASPTIPGWRDFFHQTGASIIFVTASLVLGSRIHILHSMIYNILGYLPIFFVLGYFAWLRSFHPDRVPGPFATGSPQFRKLKRIRTICLLAAVGMMVAVIAAIFAGCICNNEKVAAHLDAWATAAGILIYLPFAAGISLQAYIKERNKTASSKQGPRSLEARLWRGYLKPIHSDHWGHPTENLSTPQSR